MNVGYLAANGRMRMFVKYNILPTLTSADVIVSAGITLTLSSKNGSSPAVVEVRGVTESWSNSDSKTRWADQPDSADNVEDYAYCTADGPLTWEITELVRSWYAGSNYGMMFKATDAIENAGATNWMRFYPSSWVGTEKPVLTIVYRNNNGLEGYWDYTTASAGRAGTGYVNQFTGNMVWIHNDIGFGGNRMPVSINHVYNANDSDDNSSGMGYGWRTNYNQKVSSLGYIGGVEYCTWEDADGTTHYFEKSGSVYKDEDGLELTLTVNNASTDKRYEIKDKYGNLSYFDSSGRLREQVSNQNSNSKITITYTTSTESLIQQITDGVGRKYNFSYSNGLLNKITYVGTGSAEISSVSYTYGSNLLTKITYKDGKFSNFTYNGKLLISAQDVDSYKLAYTYTESTPSRVKTVTETDEGAAGGKLQFQYVHNQTTITDITDENNPKTQVIQFNSWGNTISVQDDLGRAQYAQFALNGVDDTASGTQKGNQLQLNSKMQNTVVNLLDNSSFEGSTDWQAISSNIDSCSSWTHTLAYHGEKFLRVNNTSTTAAGVQSPAFTLGENETCTFSAYVYTNVPGAHLELYDGTNSVRSESIPAQHGSWMRLDVSYTAASEKTMRARLIVDGKGTVFMDCIQVEKTATPSRYNLVENGDFRYTTRWSSSSGRTTVSANKPPQLNSSVYKLVGDPTAKKRVSQTVKVKGNAGDTLVLSGWALGNSAPLYDHDGDKSALGSAEFAIIATLKNGSAVTDVFKAQFNPDMNSEGKWQYAATPIVATQAYTSITIELAYDYNVNTAYFDGIQLFKEQFGSSYTYDADGNIISVKDLQGKTTSYEYTNNNLTKEILPTGAQLTYTYDSRHNVTQAKSSTNVTYDFTYDSYGNNTSVSITSGTVKLTSTAAYTSDGNRLTSTKDAAGNTTTYSYNANTNVLEWVKYPNDSDNTKTTYSYDDNMYRLVSAAATVDTGGTLSASYGYTDDLLTSITTPSTTYNFTYGDFGLRSSVKVGSGFTLATYSYTDGTNYLEKLDYGNDNHVKYEYDSQGRVIKDTYEDKDTVTYQYDNTGALGRVTDSATGISTTYYYDLTDRLMRYTEKGSGYSHIVGYAYDTLNNLTSLVETINGTEHTTSYTYDSDNRVSSVTNGKANEAYTYDNYSRLTKKVTNNVIDESTTTVLTDTFTYRSSSTGTTGQVAKLVSDAAAYDVTYEYTYDNNGNITSVKSGTKTTSYVYDSANQLIRENNQAANKTWTWSYDSAGNITSRKEYGYTTGTLGTPTGTVAYTYGNTTWGDLLTKYGSSTITSDAIGNMLSDGTLTFTWEHGRELATVKKGSTTWTNTYNADGLRTKRTNGSTTYSYVYNGSSLSQMTVGDNALYFAYDASGSPLAVTYDGDTYYYALNLQGDVMAILNASGTAVVQYTYDAWGNILTSGGTMASTLGTHNPLRYRGYVYDTETGLYYLQSRYYNPAMGRFINADGYPATGQGLLSHNMFAYCLNNPVHLQDSEGTSAILSTLGIMAVGGIVGGIISAATSALTQYTVSGSVDVASVFVAAAYGFVGGAVSASPLGATAQMIMGAVIGGVSYYADCKVTGKEINAVGMGTAIIFGWISGVIGGPGANKNFALSDLMEYGVKTIEREGRRANQQYAQKVIASTSAYVANELVCCATSSSLRFYAGNQLANGAAYIADCFTREAVLN